MPITAVILFLSVFVAACESAELPPADHAALGFYGSHKEIISELETKGETKTPSEYFMLGAAYKNDKQPKKALFNFANSCFVSKRSKDLKLYPQPVFAFATSGFGQKSMYYEDAIYEIAAIMFSYREYEYTEKFADKVSKANTGLRCDAAILKARAMQAAGKPADAAKFLAKEIAAASNDKLKRKLLIRSASAHEAAENIDAACKDYFAVLNLANGLSPWQAGIAAKELYRIASEKQLTFSASQNELIAKAFYSAGKYNECFDFIKATNTNADEYALRCLVRLKSRDADQLAKAIKGGTLIQADELWRAGRREQAVAIYRGFNANETALNRTATFLIDRNRQGAEESANAYLEKFPQGNNTEYMLWHSARYKLKAKKNEEAKPLLLKYVADFPDGKYSDQCRFWLYKIYSAAGDKKSAGETALQLANCNPDSPYTFLLLERIVENQSVKDIETAFAKASNEEQRMYYHCLLTIKQQDTAARDKRIAKLPASLMKNANAVNAAVTSAAAGKFKDGQLCLLDKFVAIGYSEGIDRIINNLNNASNAEKAAALAYLGLKYGYPLYSAYYGQQLLKELNVRENIFVMPNAFVAMVLPRPFADEVKRNASKQSLAPEQIYALMKAESMFNHKVKSSAGAVGLMQLMPATAKDIAKNSGVSKYNLQNPNDSISFGAYYLGWLNRYYKSNMTHMAAAYNAGAGNVNKWIKAMPNEDPDYFAEFVAFTETRYYILRTGKFLRQYNLTRGLHEGKI